MAEVLTSGKASFKIEVPYRLFESGKSGEKKPLILYLHGFGQNIDLFQKKVEPMLDLNAYHLFVQGPYPLYDRSRKKKVEQWGRSWYLYDGEQAQFIKSLEVSSEFLQEVLDTLLVHVNVSRLCVTGYSMGGYLAGYFALSRWKHVNDLVVIGGRIKTEVFQDRERHYEHMNVLALHGTRDESVDPGTQRDSVRALSEWGANVEFNTIDEKHGLTARYINVCIDWLKNIGYSGVES